VLACPSLADLAQIEADATTHPDQFTREGIIKAVTPLRDIAEGRVFADLARELAAT
jgi:hypothetical protein